MRKDKQGFRIDGKIGWEWSEPMMLFTPPLATLIVTIPAYRLRLEFSKYRTGTGVKRWRNAQGAMLATPKVLIGDLKRRLGVIAAKRFAGVE